jgi:hypothetical protein
MNSRTANQLALPPAAPVNPRTAFRRVARGCAVVVLGAAFAILPARADDEPDARDILKTVRVAQSAQNNSLNGAIRTGGKSLPFRLTSSQGTIRYQFTNPEQVIQLRLGDSGARLEEITDGKAQKVSPRQFTEQVRDTDISYEDLSLGFLYWDNAKVRGEQTMLLQKCWIVRVEPSAKGVSQYSKVDLWISKKNGALMQAEAFDANGKLARKFKVISGQPVGDGLWILKEMRIEAFAGRSSDRTPTYLEIDKPRS